MKIAVLSGKGGAGKTMTAVNLASALGCAAYVDCDVEEPNGRLFWKPEQLQHTTVSTLLPAFDSAKCSGCRKCVDFCRFHALIFIKDKPMVFPEVCHSCGGCSMVCPGGAVSETERPIGMLEIGTHGKIRVISGILNPGEASGVPVIRAALKAAQNFPGPVIADCPPGSACSVMESVSTADYCILVTEPTAFGFHNFRMVHELVSLLKKPCGVVINRQDSPYEPLEQYCRTEGLPVLARIPYDPGIAQMISRGEILCEKSPRLRAVFENIALQIGGPDL